MITRGQLSVIMLMGLALAGCHRGGGQKSVDQLDHELMSENAADPAVKAALEDQIMVDPQLAAHANEHSVRPPDEPYSTPLPPTERNAPKEAQAPRTADQTAQAAVGAPQAGCNFAVAYSATWATRLPPEMPIYPQGHVTEAAGTDTTTCHLRVVSFTTSAPVASVADFYAVHAHDAGYVGGQSGDTFRATRKRDGAMVVITLTPTSGGGSAIDLVTNAGI